MSLPENKLEHKRIHSHNIVGGRLIPKIICVAGCPACAVAARDKEWAKWLLANHDLWVFVQIIMPEDFEALKKLAAE